MARIYLPDSIRNETREENRDTIVHELVHCHFGAMDGIVQELLSADQCKPYVRMFEYGVDAMACVIARHMPLPEAIRPAAATHHEPVKRAVAKRRPK